MLKLSYTSKLHCPAFGLPSWKTCPVKGEICRVACYAHYGMGRMTNVASALESNLQHIQGQNRNARDLLAIIPEGIEYFRWFWSGDCPNAGMARDIVTVALSRPDTKFWVATRTYFFDRLELPENLVVRRSSEKMDDATISNGATTVLTPGTSCPSHVWECPGECGVPSTRNCRICWEFPTVPVAYRFHGSAVARLQLNKYLREKKA